MWRFSIFALVGGLIGGLEYAKASALQGGEIAEVLGNGIVPDVIPATTSFRNGMEPIVIEVSYGSHKVKTGETLTIEQTKKEPTIHFTPLKQDEMYIVVLMDPDAPKRGGEATQADWMHSVTKYIPTKKGKLESTPLLKYEGPGPPKDSGLHRYVFLLFAGKKDTQLDPIPGSTGRGKQKVMDWAKSHNLDLLGTNNFQLQADD